MSIAEVYDFPAQRKPLVPPTPPRAPDNQTGFARQHQGGVDDQTAAEVFERALQTVGKRGVDFAVRERAHRNGDEAVAEIAVGIEVAGRAALDRRMIDIHRIGDQSGDDRARNHRQL